MRPNSALKESNIAEYLLYIYQIEAMVRNFNLDLELIKNQLLIPGSKSPEDLAKEYEDFSNRLKKALPKTKLVYLAVRPSLSRIAIVDKQKQFNSWLADYCKSQKGRFFLDMHSPFYLPDGTVMPDIFVADRLHLNEKGYLIFSAKIREFILEKKLR